MKKILIDTSAYSAFMRGNDRVKLVLQQAQEIYINPVIIGEFPAGFSGGRKLHENREILEEFPASPRVVVISIDTETSERYAALYQVRSDEILIVAIAHLHQKPERWSTRI